MLKQKKHVILVALAIIMAASLLADADTLYLKSGRKIEGTIESETATSVIIKTTLAGSMTIPKERIDRIEKSAVTAPAETEKTAAPVMIPQKSDDMALEPFLSPKAFAWLIAKENPEFKQTAISKAWNDPAIRAWKKRVFKDVDNILKNKVGFTIDEALELPITTIALSVEIEGDFDKGPGFIVLVQGNLGAIWNKIAASAQKSILDNVKLPLADLLTTVPGNGIIGLMLEQGQKEPSLFFAFPAPASNSDQKEFKKYLQPKTFSQATDYDEKTGSSSFKLTEIYIPNGPQYYYAFLKDYVVLTDKREGVFPIANRLLVQPGPPSSSHSGDIDKNADFYGVVNLARFVPSLLSQLKSEGKLPPNFDQINKVLGLNRYTDIIFQSKVAGKGLSGQFTLNWTGQTSPPVKWFGQPGEFDTMKMIHADAENFETVRLVKPTDIFNDVMKIVKELGGDDAVAGVEKGLEEFKKEAGFSLVDDLLAHLSGEFGAIVTANTTRPALPNMPTIPDMEIFLKASNKTSLQSSFTKIINNLITEKKVPIQTKSYKGVSYYSLSPLPIIQLSFGFVGDCFVFVFGKDSLDKTIDTYNDGPTIANSAKMKEAKKYVEWPAVTFGLSDISYTVNSLNNMTKVNPQLKGMELPDMSLLSKYTFPAVRSMTRTDNSLTMKSYSSGLEPFVFMGGFGSIFSAMVVPNFMNAQSRAKTARSESEIRMMKNALEAFFIDNNTYPVPMEGNYIDQAGIKIGNRTVRLNNPVSYISSFPKDPNDASGKAYRYFSDGKSYYILAGNGPDGDADYDVSQYKGERLPQLKQYIYDPANGANSSGDIIHVGP